jgi:hypothetical protein
VHPLAQQAGKQQFHLGDQWRVAQSQCFLRGFGEPDFQRFVVQGNVHGVLLKTLSLDDLRPCPAAAEAWPAAAATSGDAKASEPDTQPDIQAIKNIRAAGLDRSTVSWPPPQKSRST